MSWYEWLAGRRLIRAWWSSQPTRYCFKCGATVPEGCSYCVACGAPINY